MCRVWLGLCIGRLNGGLNNSEVKAFPSPELQTILRDRLAEWENVVWRDYKRVHAEVGLLWGMAKQ